MGTWQLTYGPYANIRPYVNMHTDPSASWARCLYSRLAAPAAPTVAGPLVCEGKGRRGKRPPGWRRECVAAVHETVAAWQITPGSRAGSGPARGARPSPAPHAGSRARACTQRACVHVRTQAGAQACRHMNVHARTYTCRSSDAIQLGGARAAVSSPCACPPSC